MKRKSPSRGRAIWCYLDAEAYEAIMKHIRENRNGYLATRNKSGRAKNELGKAISQVIKNSIGENGGK